MEHTSRQLTGGQQQGLGQGPHRLGHGPPGGHDHAKFKGDGHIERTHHQAGRGGPQGGERLQHGHAQAGARAQAM